VDALAACLDKHACVHARERKRTRTLTVNVQTRLSPPCIQCAHECIRSVKTHAGATLKIHRVTLEDFVLNMARQGTPVYPKDACSILMMLNLDAGASVLEV
jgi:tRNA A58 N-methylase Trm61